MSRRILIVDDEPNIVTSLQFLMERSGYDVAVARTGQDALDQSEAEPPDLVILDVMLPGINGYEVCHRLKTLPGTHAVKVIMLTAKGREVEIAKGKELGADEYVTKPFSTRDLVELVGTMLGER
jgi:two-component system, OmpR family, alkaline phosphatase synthesis response regulator PhoP